MTTEHSLKVNKILVFIFILASYTTAIHAQKIKKIIQVTFLADTRPAFFSYYDSSFVQSLNLFTRSKTDSVIVKEIYISAGEVFRYSATIMKEGKPQLVVRSFIVPPSDDTIKFEKSKDDLKIKNGIKYFIEDVVDILNADPRLYQHKDNTFLEDLSGLDTIRQVFRANVNAIEDKFRKSLCSKSEHDILSIIAETDYYTRLLYYAQKNKRYIEIETSMSRLASRKELIQSVRSSALTLLFSQYIGYIIFKDHLDTKDAANMIKVVKAISWHRNITTEYFVEVFEDLPLETAVAIKCYEELKTYMNGEYAEKLAKIARSILPKLENTDKAVLSTIDGKQLSFQELLKSNSNKFLLIDLWASWCLPCRKEAPFFESAKSDFPADDIVFVSISLDEDNKVAEWKKALKEDGFLNATNHYRLVMPTNNPLFKNFGVSSIPRYILINSKGEFIHPNFHIPSDPKFKEALTKIIGLRN